VWWGGATRAVAKKILYRMTVITPTRIAEVKLNVDGNNSIMIAGWLLLDNGGLT
jgi:hypothetical protein